MAYGKSATSLLRRRMIDDLTLRKLSSATQRSYMQAVAKFSRYFDRSPDQLGLEDVRGFQVYLVSQGISWPALNQTVCALRFFYGVTLNRAEITERIARGGSVCLNRCLAFSKWISALVMPLRLRAPAS